LCCGAIKPSAFRALKLPKTCVETSFFARFQAFGMDLVRDEWRAVLSCYEKKHTSSWVGATVPDSRVI
jgi:hypothetical protein